MRPYWSGQEVRLCQGEINSRDLLPEWRSHFCVNGWETHYHTRKLVRGRQILQHLGLKVRVVKFYEFLTASRTKSLERKNQWASSGTAGRAMGSRVPALKDMHNKQPKEIQHKKGSVKKCLLQEREWFANLRVHWGTSPGTKELTGTISLPWPLA